MRNELIVIVLFVIAAAILFYIQWGRRHSEGYETIMNKVQDRANPLAAPIHPLKNPNAEHGISESSGANLREVNITALNTGLDMRRADQDLTIGKRTVRLSPRIDNENSFLGMVKFCKDIVDESAKASPPANPFNNPTFKKHCGVCMGSGSLITGESFSRLSNNGRGTGILVYEEDKNRAKETQVRNNYKYPRAIPSLDAAQCSGTSLYDDSQIPVLAINSKMYYDMLARLDCINNKKFKDDHTCGRCVTGGTENIWSYVKNPTGKTVTDFENGLTYDTSAAINPIFLDLYGLGNAKVTIGGKEILGSDNQPIGSVALKINSPTRWDLSKTSLGYAKEGETFIIELSAVNNGFAYVGGMLRGNAPPDSVESKLQVANVYMKDTVSGGRTARGPRIATSTDNIITFIPSTEPGNTKRINPVLKMECFVPLTFISSSWDNDHPQIAYYDCLNNPYITSGLSENLLTDDACIRDKSLNRDLSVECLQNLLSEIGCTSAGSWWRYTNTLTTDAGSKDTDVIRSYLTKVFPTASTNQAINKKCFGIDTSNPCDDYLGKDTQPSAECLIQLYTNQITENRRLTPTQKEVYRTEAFTTYLPQQTAQPIAVADYPLNYRSLDKNTDQFCRPGAGLDPSTPTGLARLQGISNGYSGLKGVDAVKKYLTDMYDRAVNTSLDIHSDGENGRKKAWMDCFGIPIAAPKNRIDTQYAPENNSSTLLNPATATLSEFQNAFINSGCTKTLVEDDLWWWRTKPRDTVLIDMALYYRLASTCSGSSGQHEFCLPGKCLTTNTTTSTTVTNTPAVTPAFTPAVTPAFTPAVTPIVSTPAVSTPPPPQQRAPSTTGCLTSVTDGEVQFYGGGTQIVVLDNNYIPAPGATMPKNYGKSIQTQYNSQYVGGGFGSGGTPTNLTGPGVPAGTKIISYRTGTSNPQSNQNAIFINLDRAVTGNSFCYS